MVPRQLHNPPAPPLCFPHQCAVGAWWELTYSPHCGCEKPWQPVQRPCLPLLLFPGEQAGYQLPKAKRSQAHLDQKLGNEGLADDNDALIVAGHTCGRPIPIG